MSRIIKFEKFSLEFSNFLDSDAKKKKNDFLIEYSPTSAVFSIEMLMEEREILVTENQKLEKRSKSK